MRRWMVWGLALWLGAGAAAWAGCGDTATRATQTSATQAQPAPEARAEREREERQRRIMDELNRSRAAGRMREQREMIEQRMRERQQALQQQQPPPPFLAQGGAEQPEEDRPLPRTFRVTATVRLADGQTFELMGHAYKHLAISAPVIVPAGSDQAGEIVGSVGLTLALSEPPGGDRARLEYRVDMDLPVAGRGGGSPSGQRTTSNSAKGTVTIPLGEEREIVRIGGNTMRLRVETD